MCTTSYAGLWAQLAARFAPGEVKKRQGPGKVLFYITARTVMNRLDDVVGPENWWDSYEPQERSVICHLTIRLPDGMEITKCDAGAYAGMQDAGDDEKSGLSDAFKRAAVKFGIGRYLYEDGVPQFVRDMLAPGKSQPRDDDLKHEEKSDLPTTGKELYTWLLDMKHKTGVDVIASTSAYGKTMGWPERIIDYSREQVSQVAKGLTADTFS